MLKRYILFLSFLSLFLVFSQVDLHQGFAADNELQPGDVNVVPLQVTGPAKDRLNLVIFGDGYSASEMDKFRADVDRNQNVQWSVEPFRSYRNYFNVYMIETPSVDSGIGCDPDDGNVRRNTVFSLYLQSLSIGDPAGGCAIDPNKRALVFGPGGAQVLNKIMKDHVEPLLGIPANSQNIQTLTIGNTLTYGGIGGGNATTTGGSPQGPLVSLHELGHSLGLLQDEYPYYDRGDRGAAHPNREPSSLHHTRMTSEQMIASKSKWWRWLGEESESGGIIRGADVNGHESGQYYGTNIWRPSEHSMMRTLGFYFDQVGREQMTQRITGMRNANKMPVYSTEEGQVGPNDVVWVETMHPRFHELNVTWEINGELVADTDNSRHLELAKQNVKEGDSIKATIKDQTEFVRDPSYLNGPRMTQTRSWTVGEPLPKTNVVAEITNHTPNNHALAFNEVVFVETTHPVDRVFSITWELNGKKIANPHNSGNFDLSKFDLPEGASQLRVTVKDGNTTDTVEWTVDNGLPTAPKTLSESLTELSGKTEHHVYFNQFDIKLEPEDDQPGFVVGELRLNGDGWHNYIGFPDQPLGTPFTFSHSGIDVKKLTYGNLGTGGMSKADFEQHYTDKDPGGPFVPGFGTHLIEHRGIDATGNIGNASGFLATVLPGESAQCDNTVTGNRGGGLVVQEGVTCLENAQINGGVTIKDGASLVAFDSTINGGLQSDGAHTVQLFSTKVNGKSKISGTTNNVTLAGNEWNGGITIQDNNQVSANKKYGEYGPILAGNTINGNLTCKGNSSDVTDFGAPNAIKGNSADQCSDLKVTADAINSLLDDLVQEETIRDQQVIRALTIHLKSVSLFEKSGATNKVDKHMNGFNQLLDHHKNNGSLPVKGYHILRSYSDALINGLQ